MKELPQGSLLPESFIKKSIRFARKAIPVSLTTSLILTACGGEKVAGPTQLPATSKTGESSALPNPENPFAVLGMPFPKNKDMAIQQSWQYTGITRQDGKKEHKGIDYIKGDLDNSRTWKSFSVTAAADGKACANPPSRIGNAVLLTHSIGDTPIGSTYYGHLENWEKNIPDCNTGQTVNKRKGDKIGDAGADGAQDKNWTHLHFQVNDANGNPIDPYDLNAERNIYPRADFSDIKQKPCGPKALFINCYTKGEVVASPKDPITPISGSIKEKSVSATATPTPELSVHREGILPIGNWQFEVQGWKESDYELFRNYFGNLDKIYREGWKYVTVEGRVRNMGRDISRLQNSQSSSIEDANNLIHFSFLSENGNKYDLDNLTYATSVIPPRFSNGFFVSGWIPEIQNNYELSAVSLNKKTPNAPIRPEAVKKIKKGEVSKNQPDISLDVETNEINKPWTIPSFGEITYNNKTVVIQGNRLEDLTVDRKKYRIYQYISLNLQNNTGQDISPTSLSFVIFSKSGDIIEGERATKEGLEPPIVAPGLKKTFYVYVPIEDTKKIEEEIKGGFLVGISKNNWFIWQLP